MTDRAVLARRWKRFTQLVAVVIVVVVAVAVWPRDDDDSSRASTNGGETTSTSGAGTSGSTSTSTTQPLLPYPGMPAVVDPSNIYSQIGPENLSPSHASDPPRVYVPNGRSNTVSVIDPSTREVVDAFDTSGEPQHVVPSYDLATLWVLDNQGNDVVPVDPATGQPGEAISVEDPYNMYFTPDGASAIIVAEAKRRLDFRDPNTMELQSSLEVPDCAGMNHADYSADGSYLLVTCEFAGKIAKIDVANRAVLATLDLTANPVQGQPTPKAKPMPEGSVTSSMPQDIRAGPDGHHFYVADMMAEGVFKIDGDALQVTKYIETGPGAHGITPNRHGTQLYIANRGTDEINGEAGGPGSVSVIALANDAVTANWPVPQGGSPDMGNLNEDGTELWLSGRFDGVVYVFDTINGGLTETIQVGEGPHGLTFWPQPGRFSLGHTGNMR